MCLCAISTATNPAKPTTPAKSGQFICFFCGIGFILESNIYFENLLSAKKSYLYDSSASYHTDMIFSLTQCANQFNTIHKSV